MAKAAKRISMEWDLDDYYRLVRITLGCGINAALWEMERRVVAEQILLICREYDADYNFKGNAVVINRVDFLRNYTFTVDIGNGNRVRVAKRRPEAGVFQGGMTFIGSELVQIGSGRVMDGYYYTVGEQPSPPASPPAPDVVKKDVPTRKRRRSAPEKPKENSETRLISLMTEIGLEKSGLLPREVRKKLKPLFKDKYPSRDKPSDPTIDRAYKKYKNAK
jgi:hypothetical protein